MRLDHIAYRVKDRHKTAAFLCECLGYRIAADLPEGFDIQFEDGSMAKCLVLEPKEKVIANAPWTTLLPNELSKQEYQMQEYHLAPEIFVSDGSNGSIVKEWVEARGGVGGIHHLAYQVDSVQDIMEEWKAKGYAEFTTEEPLKCPELVQVFTKPSELTGVIYEFIERGVQGFCKDNVKDLMVSTKNL